MTTRSIAGLGTAQRAEIWFIDLGTKVSHTLRIRGPAPMRVDVDRHRHGGETTYVGTRELSDREAEDLDRLLAAYRAGVLREPLYGGTFGVVGVKWLDDDTADTEVLSRCVALPEIPDVLSLPELVTSVSSNGLTVRDLTPNESVHIRWRSRGCFHHANHELLLSGAEPGRLVVFAAYEPKRKRVGELAMTAGELQLLDRTIAAFRYPRAEGGSTSHDWLTLRWLRDSRLVEEESYYSRAGSLDAVRPNTGASFGRLVHWSHAEVTEGE